MNTAVWIVIAVVVIAALAFIVLRRREGTQDAPQAAVADPVRPAATAPQPAAVGADPVPATPDPAPAAAAPAAGPHPGSMLPTADGSAPSPEYQIKANDGSKRYHDPSSPYYVRTRADLWFRDGEDATAAGYRSWKG